MSEIYSNPDRLRFDELLPFYITGRISVADQSFMQGFISTNPSARQAVNFALELGRIIRSTGVMRNPNVTLQRLLANFNAARKAGQGSGSLSKLRKLGIKATPPLIIAIVILGGQAINYAIDNTGSQQKRNMSDGEHRSRIAITLKAGADIAALTEIAQSFGGKIVHSAAVDGVTKHFVEIMDESRVQAFVDALAASGIIESAAVIY